MSPPLHAALAREIAAGSLDELAGLLSAFVQALECRVGPERALYVRVAAAGLHHELERARGTPRPPVVLERQAAPPARELR
jgi:hypothetical protein